MIVLDTSVIIEYIDLNGDFHGQTEIVFQAINAGMLEAYIPHPILAETYNIATRIYDILGFIDSHNRAKKLIEWLYTHPNIIVVGDSLELAIEAGKLKHELKLALTDCYVFAVSRLKGAKAVFRKREVEMIKVLDKIEKQFDVVFLEDY